MIIAQRKPFEPIWGSIKGYHNVLILGCGTCVSVCQSGGEKEVGLLASELRMKSELEGHAIKIDEATIERQCDREFFDAVKEEAGKHDAILSMACGAGVQFTAEVLEPIKVMPALDTRFIGVTTDEGIWAEKCRACGNCLLSDYGGICPITICAKSLVSGPCGGSRNGKCEASQEKDCAWVLIYNRLQKQGHLDDLRRSVVFKDFSTQTHPGRYSNEAYQKPELEAKSA
jgi:ferredoxin